MVRFALADVDPTDLLLAGFGDRFRLVAQLEGGEGTTFHVVDESATRRAGTLVQRGIRILPPGESPGEGALLAALRHPALPKVHEIGMLADGRSFVLRDWIEGYVPDRLPRDPEVLREWLRELLEVLAYVHQRGVLHLDLKPRNLVVRAGSESAEVPDLAVLDFGMAVRSGHRAVGSTPFFAAPELLLGAVPDARADLFSLGAMVAQALWPRGGLSLARFVRQFPGVPFDEACGRSFDELPPPFDTFVRQCVSRRPQRRFPDAQAALEYLCGRSGRPARSLLEPDPVAMFGRKLLGWLPPTGNIVLAGGVPQDRRALAMHVAAENGDVHAIEEHLDRTVLVRDDDSSRSSGTVTWSVPEHDKAGLARHLQELFGFGAEIAEPAVEWLTQRARTDGRRVVDVLESLVDAGDVIARGSRWAWPNAQNGTLVRAPRSRPWPTTAAEIHSCVAPRIRPRTIGARAVSGFTSPGSSAAKV